MKKTVNEIKEKMGLNNLIRLDEVELNDNDYYKVQGEPFSLYTKAELKAKGVPNYKIIRRVSRRDVRK